MKGLVVQSYNYLFNLSAVVQNVKISSRFFSFCILKKAKSFIKSNIELRLSTLNTNLKFLSGQKFRYIILYILIIILGNIILIYNDKVELFINCSNYYASYSECKGSS